MRGVKFEAKDNIARIELDRDGKVGDLQSVLIDN